MSEAKRPERSRRAFNMIEKWCMYLTKREDGSFYIRHASNLKRCFKEHSSGKGGRYTKLHKPIEIMYKEEFLTKKEAMKREKQVKGWRKDKKKNLFKR